MRMLALTLATLTVAAFMAVGAGPAAAATEVSVTMRFTEPLKAGTPGSSPCPDIALNFNCGSGEVIPFGHATEEVAIGVCGDTCNIRTIDLPQGSIFSVETADNPSCPGACGSQSYPHVFPPFSADLTDVIVGGTGIFAGAAGTLTGTVVAAGWHAQIQLSGTITLDS